MFDHYAKFIKGEQLKINRNIDIFAVNCTVSESTDTFTDTYSLQISQNFSIFNSLNTFSTKVKAKNC